MGTVHRSALKRDHNYVICDMEGIFSSLGVGKGSMFTQHKNEGW